MSHRLAAAELVLCFCPSSGCSVGLQNCYMMTTTFGNKKQRKSIFIMLQTSRLLDWRKAYESLTDAHTRTCSYTHPKPKTKKKRWHRSAALDPYQCLYCYSLLDNLMVLIDDFLEGGQFHPFLSGYLLPDDSNMHRPMPNCCLHSLNACSASPSYPPPASSSLLTLSCVRLPPLQIRNGWSRVFQESFLVRVLLFLPPPLFSSLPNCRQFHLYLLPVPFWVIKSKSPYTSWHMSWMGV
ncbi:hypothetical protein J3F83DRAFT_173309 [Trichoderma novae-zelandiae]